MSYKKSVPRDLTVTKPTLPEPPRNNKHDPRDLVEARQYLHEDLTMTSLKYLQMDKKTLDKAAENGDLSTLDHVVISILKNAIKFGDQNRIEFLLNRIVGKPPVMVGFGLDSSTRMDIPFPDVSHLSEQELLEFTRLYHKSLEKFKVPDGANGFKYAAK